MMQFLAERLGIWHRPINLDEIGKFRRIDLSGLNDAQRRQLLEARVDAMKGSYGSTPGGIVAIVREVKEMGQKKLTLETAHDALVRILTRSRVKVNLSDPKTVDAAWIIHFEHTKPK